MKKLIIICAVTLMAFAWAGPTLSMELTLEHFEPGLEAQPGNHAVRGIALSPDELRLYAAHWQGGNDPIAVYSTEDYSLLDVIYGGPCVCDAVTRSLSE